MTQQVPRSQVDAQPIRLAWRLPADVAQADGTPVDCGVTVWRPIPEEKGADRHAAIFYLHGGGLLYGVREDLPAPYRELLTTHGYTLVCVDYPLAPQVAIGAIAASAEALWQRCANELLPRMGIVRAFLCGRSAGAYLALLLAGRLGHAESGRIPIAGVMDFYGYCDLPGTMSAALWQPSMHYRRLVPAISPRMARKLSGTRILTSASLQSRFGLYAYARQTGRWGELLGITRKKAAVWSLDKDAQRALPPLFVAASSDDADVPFACSERLAQTAPDATTFFVHGLEHDFDRDTRHPEGMRAWRACVDWADALL